MDIKIVFDNTKRITDHRDESDEWSADSTHTDVSIKGIHVVSKKQYSDLTIPFDVVANKPYFLLMVRYTTGNSFAKHTGQIDFVDLYQSAEKAYQNKKAIQQHYQQYQDDNEMEDQFNIQLTMDDGQKVQFSPSWIGYFESLESVDVVMVEVI
jgi:hypothetical protein